MPFPLLLRSKTDRFRQAVDRRKGSKQSTLPLEEFLRDGPYGFADPWGYRLLPAFDFAPILTRLTTVFTIDDPAFDGDEAADNADGLPQPRKGPVGERFLSPAD